MKIIDPIVIVGAPRSGTTWLKELLTFHSALWHLPQESHNVLEGPLHPKNFTSFSNRPDEKFKLSGAQIKELRKQFWQEAVNISVVPGGTYLLNKFRGNRYTRKGFLNLLGQLSRYYKPAEKEIRFIEKTPKNIVRLPSIHQIFPSAKYIYIKRDPIENINSILKGWHTDTSLFYKLIKRKPRFASAGYKINKLQRFNLSDGFKTKYWRFVLPPGWQNVQFQDLMDIAIFQYQKSNELAEYDLTRIIKPNNIFRVKYEDVAGNTENMIEQLLNFTNLPESSYDFKSLYKMPRINQANNKRTLAVSKKEIERRLGEII